MNDNFNQFFETEDFSTDNRSDHDEEYELVLRVKMDKKILDSFVSYFPKTHDGNLPSAVRWFLGGKLSFGMYLSNAATSEHPDSINMVLATDSDNKHNTDLLAELGGMTLSVFGFNTPGWFYVTSIRKVPFPVGSLSNRVIKSKVTFCYNPIPEAANMPQRLINRIFELPNILEETKYINNRISHWDEYLKINGQIAEESQLLLSYSGYKNADNISQIIFNSDVSKMNSAHMSSDIQLVIDIEYENGHPIYKGPVIGSVSSFDGEAGELTVDMDYDFREMLSNGRAEIPHKAKLFITKWGDLVQIRRLRGGLQTFARGQAANPYLDVFLFDSSKARLPAYPGETIAEEDLLQPGLNPEQKRAVEGVINSDDMYLIQGPPGTGKTTVIAEICYQNAIRGQKTLIASQTNLAVDNALGKLVHHPKIRALRKGNEQSVQEEGKHFTENNVIKTWLEKTSAHCKQQLEPRSKELARVKSAEDGLSDTVNLYATYNDALKQRNTEGINRANLERSLEEIQRRQKWLERHFEDFLENTDEMSVRSLIENPFGAPEDFTQQIALCYKTKYTLDIRRGEIKECIDTILSGTDRLRDMADSIRESVHQLDKKGEFRMPRIPERMSRKISFEEWQKMYADCLAICQDAVSAKPSGIRRILGGGKGWFDKAFCAIEHFCLFENASQDALDVQKSMMKSLIETNPLPEMTEKLAVRASELKNEWAIEAEKAGEQLAKTDALLEEARKVILDTREAIHTYNENLPYGVRADSIDEVCKQKDIRAYYTGLWNERKSDDARLAEFLGGWIGRIDGVTDEDYDDFKQLYINSANVIGITCSQSGSREFTSAYPTFDVAIIDEVSKATPPELILSVLKARKIVLVGDHKQLPPMLGSDTYEEVAKKLNLDEEKAAHMKVSLFEELFVKAPPELKTMLSTQYRMHPQIMDGINQFYIEENGFGLRCGLSDSDRVRKHMCHGRAIGEDDHSLWVDVPLFEENREYRSPVNRSFSNKAEVECIKNILLTINDNLRSNEYEGKKKIGIISFYSNQVHLMEREFFSREFVARTDKLSLRIGSVDRFQGIECPVVICSFVRNNDRGEIGFAKDSRRVNVALSRAQELSVIVGSTELFCYANNSPEAGNIYKTITQNIFKIGGERSVWDFKEEVD